MWTDWGRVTDRLKRLVPRSSEIVAGRFRNLDFARQVITVDTGRMLRFGGIEAEPT